jgi:hypothetical protein
MSIDLKEGTLLDGGLAPLPPRIFRFSAIPMHNLVQSRKGRTRRPFLVWPLGLRSSCVPALLYPQPRSATV